MFNSIYQTLMGTAPTSAIGSAHGLMNNPAQAQQRWAQAQGQMAAQQSQLLAQQYTAALSARQHHWMINGETMNWEEFLDAVCPDKDDPHRTYLTLKYKGTK